MEIRETQQQNPGVLWYSDCYSSWSKHYFTRWNTNLIFLSKGVRDFGANICNRNVFHSKEFHPLCYPWCLLFVSEVRNFMKQYLWVITFTSMSTLFENKIAFSIRRWRINHMWNIPTNEIKKILFLLTKSRCLQYSKYTKFVQI